MTPVMQASIRLPGPPFLGALIAGMLLMVVEASLHTDWFLYKYRAVFAAGRVIDKILVVEAAPPQILVMGNSRVDNAVIPPLLSAKSGYTAFNLGMPGAEACNLLGVTQRLARNGVFEEGKVGQVLLGLDESLLQPGSGLGFAVFFDTRERLWSQGRYLDWGKSWLRLWGYADSLKTLQEPAKFLRFFAATRAEVEPWGGSARENLGHRAADEVQSQDAGQISQQEAARYSPPDPMIVECLLTMVEYLRARDVETKVFFPPMLDRLNSFTEKNVASATPYRLLKQEFTARGITMLDVVTVSLRKAEFFANPGHLNRRGAELFTALLGERLHQRLSAAATP